MEPLFQKTIFYHMKALAFLEVLFYYVGDEEGTFYVYFQV